jgi:hypothetical protein
LESFLEKFLSPQQIIQISSPLISSELGLSQHFESNRVAIAQSPKVLKETDLQKKYFQENWKQYGENILEHTNGTIVGDPPRGAAGKFRKLNFASQGGITKFPDLTLRLPAEATLEDPGAVWRLCPWAVVAYLELKATNVSVEFHCQQGLYYAQSTLLCCPSRNYCISAIYNFHSLIFCGVRSDEGVLSYFTSGVIRDANASVEIAKFLSCPRDRLGFVDCYPFPRYPPFAALGRGSTAICVSVEQGAKVLKISRDSAALTLERDVLNYLHSKSQRISPLPIPRVLYTTSHYTLMEPVYARPPPSLTVNQFLKAWDALREVHKFGICHCDVRMPNLGVTGKTVNQYFHWMDWSSARPFRNDLPDFQPLQVGSTCTASIPVLRRMQTKKHDYLCFPSDEGISMIYLCWQQKNSGDSYLKIPHDPRVAIEMWNDQAQAFPHEVKEAVAALEAIGESYDEDALKKIDEAVRSALRALFGQGPGLKESSEESVLPGLADLSISAGEKKNSNPESDGGETK